MIQNAKVLLLLITYVFSVAFMTFGRESKIGQEYFGSMGDAMINLIMRLIFSDQALTFVGILLAKTCKDWSLICSILGSEQFFFMFFPNSRSFGVFSHSKGFGADRSSSETDFPQGSQGSQGSRVNVPKVPE